MQKYIPVFVVRGRNDS